MIRAKSKQIKLNKKEIQKTTQTSITKKLKHNQTTTHKYKLTTIQDSSILGKLQIDDCFSNLQKK